MANRKIFLITSLIISLLLIHIFIFSPLNEPEKNAKAGPLGLSDVSVPSAPKLPAKDSTDFEVFLENPVIIFSRPGCPYSAAAKKLLTETLRLDPPAVVVEVTDYEHTQELRDWLSSISDISTMPNIFVGGHSIGGSDSVRALYQEEKLQSTLDEWTHNKVLILPTD
ncbi:Monothiol glutaredoxin-3 [Schizosaccharomyces pombe]|uniref:Monothiol glutaredoxin-3 n=1 Tax=Schizosaccharomyces pombe (strain 972 / ATCC 24843) TaxID=284812 RepID=GLRX3_SCHPO|nr:monothiol glutaredoxin Grx3 [Schizosaccharomyces pombe]Q9Y7N3.3 RecName: Full=Monothiol glutaredoxin-3 [Schizosaccharomyces pombe 972h-]AAQ56717.1 glutaredoxin 3 [Schizosaccharomyces pombe]CAB40173.1 monothiol glutaredoxin Grx3 [Schizosaccharomyces pombe]|eukprot:NP_588305.1 monothiol glutaredoxin Grx3 [Schizosaccharomyces pombe]